MTTPVTPAMAEFAGRCAFHDYATVSEADPALVPSIVPPEVADAFRAGFEAERALRWPEWPAPMAVLPDEDGNLPRLREGVPA